MLGCAVVSLVAGPALGATGSPDSAAGSAKGAVCGATTPSATLTTGGSVAPSSVAFTSVLVSAASLDTT